MDTLANPSQDYPTPPVPEVGSFNHLVDLARRIKSRLNRPAIFTSDTPEDPACTSKPSSLQDRSILNRYHITDGKALPEEDTLKVHQNHEVVFCELGRYMSSSSSSCSSFTFGLSPSDTTEDREDASPLHGSFRLAEGHASPSNSSIDSSSIGPLEQTLMEEAVEDSAFHQYDHCDGGNESGRGGEGEVFIESLNAEGNSPQDDPHESAASSPTAFKGRIIPIFNVGEYVVPFFLHHLA